MSKRVADIFIITVEPNSKCELCGTVAELRPYGPNGERVCFTCGMKDEDEEEAKRQFSQHLNGEIPVINN